MQATIQNVLECSMGQAKHVFQMDFSPWEGIYVLRYRATKSCRAFEECERWSLRLGYKGQSKVSGTAKGTLQEPRAR